MGGQLIPDYPLIVLRYLVIVFSYLANVFSYLPGAFKYIAWFKEQTLPVTVVKGETTNVKVELEKA